MIPGKSLQWRDVSGHLQELSLYRSGTLVKQLKEEPAQNSIQEALNSLSQLNINDRWPLIKALQQRSLATREALYITSNELHRSWGSVLKEMQCHGLHTLWVEGQDRPYSFDACCQFSLANIPLEDLAISETLMFNDNRELICARAEWKLLKCSVPKNCLSQFDIKVARLALTLGVNGAQLHQFPAYDPFLLIQLENFLNYCEFSELSPHKQQLSAHLDETSIVVLTSKTINTVQLKSIISRCPDLVTIRIKHNNELIDFPVKYIYYICENNQLNIHTILQPVYCRTQDNIQVSLPWGFLFDLIGDSFNFNPLLDLDYESVQLALHLWTYRELPPIHSLEAQAKLHAFLLNLKAAVQGSVIFTLLEHFGLQRDYARIPESILSIQDPEIFWRTLSPWVDSFPNARISFDGSWYFQIEVLKPLMALGTLPVNILERTFHLQVENEIVSISARVLAFCFPSLFRREEILDTEQTPIVLYITKKQFETFTDAEAWPGKKTYDFDEAEALYQIALQYESSLRLRQAIERSFTRCEAITLPLDALKQRWHQFPLAERITITGCDRVWSRHEAEAFIRADIDISDFAETQSITFSDRQLSMTLAHLKSIVPNQTRWQELSNIDSGTFIIAWNHVFHGVTPLWKKIDALTVLIELHQFYCDFLPPYYVEDLEWLRVNRIQYDVHADCDPTGALNTLFANIRSPDTKSLLVRMVSQFVGLKKASNFLYVKVDDSMLADSLGSDIPLKISLVTNNLDLGLDKLHQKYQVNSLILHKPISKRLLSKIALYFPSLETLAFKAGADLVSFEALAPLTRLTVLHIECNSAANYAWSSFPTSISQLKLVNIRASNTMGLSHLTKLKELELVVTEAPENRCLLSLGPTHLTLETLAIRAQDAPEGLVSIHSLVDWRTLPNLQKVELSKLRIGQPLTMETPNLRKLYFTDIRFAPYSTVRASLKLDVLGIQGCNCIPELIGIRPTKASFDQTAFDQYDSYLSMFIRELFIITDENDIYLPGFNHIERIIVQSLSGRIKNRTICNGDHLVEAMDYASDATVFEDCPLMDPKTRLWSPKPPVKRTSRRITTIIRDRALLLMVIAAIFAAIQTRRYSYAVIPVGLYLVGKWIVVSHLRVKVLLCALAIIIALTVTVINILYTYRIVLSIASDLQQIKNDSVYLARHLRTLTRRIGG